MAKNKGTHGQGKPEVEEPDEFVSSMERAVETLRPHAKPIVVAIGLMIALSSGWATWQWWDARKEAKASTVFSEAVEVSRRGIEAEGTSEPGADITYANRKDRADATLVVLDRLRAKHEGTGVANAARPLHASILMEAGRHDEAAALYRDFAASDGDADLRAVSREGVAYALEAKALAQEDAAARGQGLQEALAAFKNIQPNDGAPHRASALFHEGRILLTLDRKDEAVAAFEKALEAEPNDRLEEQLTNRLAMLQSTVQAATETPDE